MAKPTYDKIYGEHYVIAYNPKTMEVHTAWGYNVRKEMEDRGIKYWPDRTYDNGWTTVYTEEIQYEVKN